MAIGSNFKKTMKCIICLKEADVIFNGNTFCKKHFEMHWEYITEGISSYSIVKLRKAEKNKKKR